MQRLEQSLQQAEQENDALVDAARRNIYDSVRRLAAMKRNDLDGRVPPQLSGWRWSPPGRRKKHKRLDYAFNNGGSGGRVGPVGEASEHYPALELSAICALPVKDWVEDNAVLFLWVASPVLPEAMAPSRASFDG